MSTLLFRINAWVHTKRSVLSQIILISASLLGFILLEILLFLQIGNVATALVTVPAVASGWLYGRKAGVIISALLSSVNLLLFRWLNPLYSLQHSIIAAATGMLVIMLLSYLAAWARLLQHNTQNELKNRNQMEARLRASEERYRAMFHMASDAIFVFDLEGNLLETNQVSANWLGYLNEELSTMSLVDIETVENANRLTKRIAELLECGEALYESALTRKDGSIFPIELHARLVDYQGQKAVFSIARDISQRKAIETAEREQRVLADVMHDISVDLTSTLQFEDVLERILKNIQRVIRHDAASIMILEGGQVYTKKQRGYSEREQPDKNNGAPITIDSMPLLHQMVSSRAPFIIPDVRNSSYWYEFRSNLWVRSYAGAPIIYKQETIGFINLEGALPGLFKEEHVWRLQTFANYAAISIQNARMYSHVQQMAQVDELTGLYNRRGLTVLANREVHRALRYHRPLSILLVDVDNFKSFNDLYSYLVGDEVLSKMGERLRINVRSEDLVCRWGGDEFVVLLIECGMEDALLTAEHIRNMITNQAFETSHGLLPATVSIGVASLDLAHPDLNAMIDSAGEGVHQAKAGGRNQISK